MYQLVKGVAHCHKHGVMHRDLKPQNLLVDDAIDCLKIADLGLGRAFSVPIKSYTHEARTHALVPCIPAALLSLHAQDCSAKSCTCPHVPHMLAKPIQPTLALRPRARSTSRDLAQQLNMQDGRGECARGPFAGRQRWHCLDV